MIFFCWSLSLSLSHITVMECLWINIWNINPTRHLGEIWHLCFLSLLVRFYFTSVFNSFLFDFSLVSIFLGIRFYICVYFVLFLSYFLICVLPVWFCYFSLWTRGFNEIFFASYFLQSLWLTLHWIWLGFFFPCIHM